MITWATCTPWGPSSRAIDWASARRPNFPTARHANRAPPRSDAVAPVKRTVPRPAATMAGTTSRAARNAPKQLARQLASSSLGEMSAMPPIVNAPAL